MELHAPTVNRAEHQTEALLHLLVAAPHWSQLHFRIMLSVVCGVCGLAMLTRNLADPMSRSRPLTPSIRLRARRAA